MPTPSSGITADVVRDLMPPYQLSPDLLQATVAALPPPPPDATPAWRQSHLTRLIQEIVACKPADSGQARTAAHLLIVRELAEAAATRARAPTLPTSEFCRLARTTVELTRAAVTLDRLLLRHQQDPVPFYGTVTQAEVDLAALDASWRGGSPQPLAPYQPPPPQPADTTPPAPTNAEPAQSTAPTPTPRTEPPAQQAATLPAQPDRSAEPAHHSDFPPHTRPAAPGSDWTITKLDEGPGWTREVLRHRSNLPAANAATPDATR